ncbi:hypothetical protein WJX81_001624 [Elliptochloris bilobata]|uniref:Uncharacterized protein n=1 Tax=Elliptochloris bilobata TaxID=381761 RepID=A0AAW1S9F1_9CHLO
MGWRELEAARLAQTSAEISARLAAIAAASSYNPFFRQDKWRASAPEEREDCVRPPSHPASPAEELAGPAAEAAADELEVYKEDWSLDVLED